MAGLVRPDSNAAQPLALPDPEPDAETPLELTLDVKLITLAVSWDPNNRLVTFIHRNIQF